MEKAVTEGSFSICRICGFESSIACICGLFTIILRIISGLFIRLSINGEFIICCIISGLFIICCEISATPAPFIAPKGIIIGFGLKPFGGRKLNGFPGAVVLLLEAEEALLDVGAVEAEEAVEVEELGVEEDGASPFTICTVCPSTIW